MRKQPLLLLLILILPGSGTTEERYPKDTGAVVAHESTRSDFGLWENEWFDRIQENGLYRYAAKIGGGVASRSVSDTTEFDGAKYGTLRVNFENGVRFSVKTSPPESALVELEFARNEPSSKDAMEAMDALRVYTTDTGINIMWDSPLCHLIGGRRRCRYVGADDGVNAKAEVVFRDNSVELITLSFAI